MIQAIGLTSAARRNRPLAVDDLTFEARPGDVTVLFGPAGAGKSTTLRLMLQLKHGRGVALFRGRPLHRVPHVAREVGVLLGDVPGHPARTARGHLQMLTAVAGVPVSRADELLDVVGLSGLADQRLGTFSLGMDRRLGLAAALLGDPHTLVLDEPDKGLASREAAWLRGMVRGFADEGGLVLTTTSDPKEATRTGDRVISVESGRLTGDQDVASFSRTRLRPRVAVSSPHAERLGSLLMRESRAVSPRGGEQSADVDDLLEPVEPVEVVHEGGGRVSVYNSSCSLVGETAYRHGILVHQLADETGEAAVPSDPLERADGRVSETRERPEPIGLVSSRPRALAAVLPPRLRAVPAPGPVWPMRYEFRRLAGVRSTWLLVASGLLLALVAACWLGRDGAAEGARLLAGWPTGPPLPPVAALAGLLGALAFGQEFRYPALAPAQAPVPRRLGLLLAKLTVAAISAVLLCVVSAAVNAVALHVLYGSRATSEYFSAWNTLLAVVLLAVGSAWAGLLAAAVFRRAVAGAVAVLAVPLVVSPVIEAVLTDPTATALIDMTERAATLLLAPVPVSGEGAAEAVAQMLAQPVGGAMALSLMSLFCVYVFGTVRSRLR